MSKRLLVLTLSGLLALTLLGPARPAAAQLRLGPHVGYNFDIEEGFFGLDFWFRLARLGSSVELHGDLGFSYYLTDVVDIWRFDFNLPFLLGRSDVVRGIVAPGLGIRHVSLGDADDTEFGLNLIGGALFLPDGVVQPTLQLRVSIFEETDAEVLFGLLFNLS